VPLADPGDLARAGRFLLDRGIYVTLAFYPGVPREEVGFRVQVTVANTDDEVTELLAALDRLADVVPLRRPQGTGNRPRTWRVIPTPAGKGIERGKGGRWLGCTHLPGWTGTVCDRDWPGR
jgi:hypothetical protein